jgi:hypothetical protein
LTDEYWEAWHIYHEKKRVRHVYSKEERDKAEIRMKEILSLQRELLGISTVDKVNAIGNMVTLIEKIFEILKEDMV